MKFILNDLELYKFLSNFSYIWDFYICIEQNNFLKHVFLLLELLRNQRDVILGIRKIKTALVVEMEIKGCSYRNGLFELGQIFACLNVLNLFLKIEIIRIWKKHIEFQ